MDPHIQHLKVKNVTDGKDKKDLRETIIDDIEIRVVDYFHTFGAFIDRDTNRRLGVRRSHVQS